MVSYRYCVRCGRRTRHARGGVDPAAARPGPMSLDTRPIDAAINGGRHCVECRARVFPARHP